jgi:hypothetical protein
MNNPIIPNKDFMLCWPTENKDIGYTNTSNADKDKGKGALV